MSDRQSQPSQPHPNQPQTNQAQPGHFQTSRTPTSQRIEPQLHSTDSLASTDTIPAFDYRGALAEQRDALLSAWARVLDSGRLILGPEVTAFENEFAAFLQTEHAIGVSSGTDALIVALRCMGVTHGVSHDNLAESAEPPEVITVANGPVPTVAAIRAVGAIPRLIDIHDSTMLMTLEAVEHAITARTRCVVAVHLYGYPVDTAALARLCRQRGLSLIEDCAQAHGTLVQGRFAGGWGDIGCFSFYPTKNLGAFGDAGLCVTRDAIIAARLREVACYGFRGDRIAHCEGLNCRLDELQAAALRVRLRYLPTALSRRREIAQAYLDGLQGTSLRLPEIDPVGQAGWHQFVVRVQARQHWIEWLASQRIEVGIHYATPIHLMPAYQFLNQPAGSLPVTEQACQQVMSLPIFPELNDNQVERVIHTLREGVRLGLK